MIQRILLAAMALLLSACATHTPLPAATPKLQAQLPLTLHIQRQTAGQADDLLLVIQEQEHALRWSLFDPIGAPLARQQLEAGAWHDDGLLPPNPQAKQLFAALLFALSTDASIEHNYPPQSWKQTNVKQRWLSPGWLVSYSAALDFTLESGDQVRYHVTKVDQSEAQ